MDTHAARRRKEILEARQRLIDRTISAMHRAEARGQWKAHMRHLARLSRLLDQTDPVEARSSIEQREDA